MKRCFSTLLALAALQFTLPVFSMECGVCAHVGRGGFHRRERTFRLAKESNCRLVRTDFDWWQMEPKQGEWNFAKYDQLLDDAETAGIEILPIFYAPPEWARHIKDHLPEWEDFIRRAMERWGKRLPCVEIWNEPFHSSKNWEFTADWYVDALKIAYKTVKKVSPSTKVLIGECNLEQMKLLYARGAAGFYDIMNLHLYTKGQVDIPEGAFEDKLAKFRQLMKANGDAGKPIWVTETGWPTPPARHVADILRAGLEVANLVRKPWKVLYTNSWKSEAEIDDGTDCLLAMAFPEGSTFEPCMPGKLAARVKKGGIDALVLPFEEACPAEAVEPAYNFLKAGGTLVDFGGTPMFAKVPKRGELPARFHVDVKAWWNDKRCPRLLHCKRSPAAPEFPEPATGFKCQRFLTGAALKGKDKFVPLVQGVASNGLEYIAAGVYLFDSELKGRFIVSGMFDHQHRVTSEERQARLVTRTLAILAANGVERTYWYEQRSNEHGANSRYGGECHFGLVRGNGEPKEAFAAFKTWNAMCPPGSSAMRSANTAELHRVYWKKPDGTQCGIVWKTGAPVRQSVEQGKGCSFLDHLGGTLSPTTLKDGKCGITISGAPVYIVSGKTL